MWGKIWTATKGWRTIALGALVAAVPSVLTYLGGVNWTSYGISPAAAGVIGIAIMGARTLTNTPVGKSRHPDSPPPPSS